MRLSHLAVRRNALTAAQALATPSNNAMSEKKALIYSQHVLGMGHFVRAMEIARGLPNFKVRFLNGGMSVEQFAYPPGVEVSDADMAAVPIARHAFHGDWVRHEAPSDRAEVGDLRRQGVAAA